MNKKCYLKILTLEDSPMDAELIYECLTGNYETEIQMDVVSKETDFISALSSKKYDLILSDFMLPDINGFAALKHVKRICPNTPFICVSGFIGEETAVELLKQGATDYVSKDKLGRLGHSIERALKESKENEQNEKMAMELLDTNIYLKNSLVSFQQLTEAVINAIALIVEKRDPYTAGHQEKVSKLACAIAVEMGYDSSFVEGIRIAGLLHDIGKIAIPIEILSKPGLLSEDEFRLIKVHPKVSYDVLKEIEFNRPIADIVIGHHERLDGSGYPKGLTGAAISMDTRILSVSDVVEAMVSYRPYRPALGLNAALAEINKNSGNYYDKVVVDTCTRLCTNETFKF